MISVDTMPFEERSTRQRKREHEATTCGYCGERVPKGHWCEQKSEALKERKCDLESCGKLFKPTTPHKAYCCDAHRKSARSQREYLNKAKRPERPSKKPENKSIAPLERQWAKAEQKAAQYVPVMGEALYEATMRLMRREAA
jgi:DNA segregation ATPase FtsK/SpoIIIE-like protein